MTNYPWIKLYSEIIRNEKLRQLSEPLKWRFIQLLALAGECGIDGYLCTSSTVYKPEGIAWQLHLDPDQLAADLQTLAEANLIAFDPQRQAWFIPTFTKLQSRPDGSTRQYWREQKRRQRMERLAAQQAPPPAEENAEEAEPSPPPEASQPLAAERPVQNGFSEPAPRHVPLKRRIDKNRKEKRRKEERKILSPPLLSSSPLDQLERELAKKSKPGATGWAANADSENPPPEEPP